MDCIDIPSPSACGSSSPLPAGEYEVFLSFRGPDARNTIADVLYHYLVRSRIRTFRDDEELRKGEEIAPSLDDAVAQSQIYIPIFSAGYASSKWCLKELAKMVEARDKGAKGHIILPIFYFVDPRDVRRQTGPYEEAFELHEKEFDKGTVREWRDALSTVGALKGWHVNEAEGQGAIVNAVFENVLSHLSNNYSLVTEELVGMDQHVATVKELLNLGSGGVKMVVIHGMGGLGKTTIAKAVSDQIHGLFDRYVFIEDTGEILKGSGGIVNLQNKIIHGIAKEVNSVTNAGQGIRTINDRVSRYKVLIGLDNVDGKFQFGKILGKPDNFASGSRFIITTRDKQVLNLFKGCGSYEPKEMNPSDSLCLFSKHAFGMDSPPEGFVDLSDKLVSILAGLPLALEVVGSLLCGQVDKDVWKEKQEQLAKIPESDVQEKLRLSFDSLTREEKQIFLDIACLFIDEKKEIASYMWKECGYFPVSAINVLVLRSLIKMGKNGEFKMHDQLRDLGREIVRQEDDECPWKRTRVWSDEDALKMLKRRQGTDAVKAIRVHNPEGLLLTDERFKKLTQLRYLEANYAEFSGDFDELLLDLKWLRLRYHKENSALQNFYPESLVILDLHSGSITDEWSFWNHMTMAKKLKVLSISYSLLLTKVPNLSAYQHLEILNLQGCSYMSQELEIGSLTNLKILKLRFSGITKLTLRCNQALDNLEEIDAWMCPNLMEIPEGMDALMPSLKILKVTSKQAYQLPNLPTTMEDLTVSRPVPNLQDLQDLERLRFEDYYMYEALPDISNSTKLTTLELCRLGVTNLSGGLLPASLSRLYILICPALAELPNLSNLGNLTELTLSSPLLSQILGLGALNLLATLHIFSGDSLIHLDGLENLVSLTSLTVNRCKYMERLPSLSALKKIEKLRIWQCPHITEIPGLGELESLQQLEIGGCTSLPALPDLSNLTRLSRLTIGDRKNLPNAEGIQSQEALEYLDLVGGESLGLVPHLGRLTDEVDALPASWSSGYAANCPALEALPTLTNLRNLTELTLSCPMVHEIPGLRELDHLASLSIYEGFNVNNLDGIDDLLSLKILTLSSCWVIKALPSLASLKKLQQLQLHDFPLITELRGLDEVKSLEKLKIVDCPSLSRLPVLSKLTELRNLRLSNCLTLQNVVGLEHLPSLERFTLEGCSSIERLPSLPRYSSKLEKVIVRYCPFLSQVESLGDWKSLKKLKFIDCTSLKTVPDLSHLENLKKLVFTGCLGLTEVSGTEHLKFLKKLKLSSCVSMEKLPHLQGLANLKILNVGGCTKLTDVSALAGLRSLKRVLMNECESLGELPDMSSLKRMKVLSFRGCKQLNEVPGLEELQSLVYLDVSGCKLRGIPHLQNARVFQ